LLFTPDFAPCHQTQSRDRTPLLLSQVTLPEIRAKLRPRRILALAENTRFPASLAALERLDRSIGRLESLSGRLVGDVPVARELEQVREDYFRLEAASRMVEGRLDGVIGRLKIMLGE